MFFNIPMITLVAGNTYMLPFIDQEIPFVPEIRDNFMFNFYPSYIGILLR